MLSIKNDSEGSECPQDQADGRSSFAFFDLDDPLAADAYSRRERLLVELLAGAVVADERPQLGWPPPRMSAFTDTFPDQYRTMDKVLGTILGHLDENTTLLIISDHGIKPLRESESHNTHMDHGRAAPIIAKHDFEDGDDVPGVFIAMGPGIKKGVRVTGLPISVFDIAPTILHFYGIARPPQMQGRILTEIFENTNAVGITASSSPD